MIYITTAQACLDVLDVSKEEWANSAKILLTSDPSSRGQALLSMPFMDVRYAYFAFLESRKLVVEEIEYKFTDVGRFEEIYSLNDKDRLGNVIMGNAILDGECRNNLIINETSLPLVVLSANDSVVIQTSAGSMVSSFKDASKIGEIYKTQIHVR